MEHDGEKREKRKLVWPTKFSWHHFVFHMYVEIKIKSWHHTCCFCRNKCLQLISYNTSKHVGPAVGVLKSLSICVIMRHYVAFCWHLWEMKVKQNVVVFPYISYNLHTGKHTYTTYSKSINEMILHRWKLI